MKFGLIPELVGRLPVIVGLENLDVDALVRIMREPKNSLEKQYKKLFAMDDVELEFTDSALREVAERAIERNTGARGIRSILEETLTELMFELPSLTDVKRVIIDDACIRGEKEPELVTE